MKSGPQKYQGASTSYWWQEQWGGDAMESNVIVWHSTEGTTLPGYGDGAMAPNFTAVPDFKNKRLTWFQHFDFDVSSRALRNAPGGVETNTLNVCQVEIVGTCDPATHERWGSTPHLYMPQLPDWVVRDLAAFARWAHDNHDVPLTSDVTFKAYPDSYGASNGVRMSYAKWGGFHGHCGHQHVPENLHGDPGTLPIARILAAAGAAATSPAPPTPVRPVVDLSRLVAAAKSDPSRSGTPVSYGGVRIVEAALVDEGLLAKRYLDGHYGTVTVKAYAAWQRRCGYSGAAADGIPGKTSLVKLGKRHGFDVKD